MSRSGYSEDWEDNWSIIRWRGAVTAAIRGKRGQKFLSELASELDAMPVRRLISSDLENEVGEHCALGVVGVARGVPLDKIDPEDPDAVAKNFGIASALAREIVFENDEASYYPETPEARWTRVRAWVSRMIDGQGID